jgi:N-acetylmuramoyl-L-alanine amidase
MLPRPFLLVLALAGALHGAPPALYSPQLSPDGKTYLWESLERGGSLWMTDAAGAHPTFVVAGHSPSWVNPREFRFVVSRDDGHQIVLQSLYEYDVAEGAASVVAHGSDNPDYHTVVQAAVRSKGRPLAGKIVCVDPGHGKGSGSKSPITGKLEDEYVLAKSYMVRDYLEAAGATVRMTRFDDSTLPALPARVNFSNAVGADAFVAVHLNSSAR